MNLRYINHRLFEIEMELKDNSLNSFKRFVLNAKHCYYKAINKKKLNGISNRKVPIFESGVFTRKSEEDLELHREKPPFENRVYSKK